MKVVWKLKLILVCCQNVKIKMSLALMNLTKKVALHSNAKNTTSAHAPQVNIKYGYCMQIVYNQWKNHEEPNTNEKSH